MNYFILPAVDGGHNKISVLTKSLTEFRKSASYKKDAFTMVIQPMLLCEVWTLNMWDFSTRSMKTLVFDNTDIKREWGSIKRYQETIRRLLISGMNLTRIAELDCEER